MLNFIIKSKVRIIKKEFKTLLKISFRETVKKVNCQKLYFRLYQ